MISGGSDDAVIGEVDQPDAGITVGFDHGDSIVFGEVVDDNRLPITEGLCSNRLERGAQKVGVVVGRNDNGKAGMMHVLVYFPKARRHNCSVSSISRSTWPVRVNPVPASFSQQ